MISPGTFQPSRRRFLEMVGKFAGAAALYETMAALDLVKVPSAWAGPPRLAQGSGAGKTVAILGAGIAGLSAAYELEKAGFDCIVLEVQNRAGGRNFTARRGTKVIEDAGPHGRTEQVCDFDDGLYINLGPGRLPHHHHRAMHYCRELDIPLEVYVLTNMANLFQADEAFGGQAQPRYRIASDTNSYVSELLGKAIDQHALDGELTPDDRVKLRSLLESFGGSLTSWGTRVETPRNGCLTPLLIDALCEPNPRLPLAQLLHSEFWTRNFYQPRDGEWQATLFQPVGGMDKIVDAFVSKLRQPIRYGCEVNRIVNGAENVAIEYRDNKAGSDQRLEADYCLSSIPLQKLAKLDTDLSPDFKQAVAYAKPGALYKLAWQANRRFWEEEPYNIYGGISYIAAPITQMWYPSAGYLSKRGVIAGAYAYHDQAEAFGRMTLTERIAAARRDAAKLHKEFADEELVPGSKAVSIAWNQAEGQSTGYTPWNLQNAEDNRAYRRLLSPDGRFFVIGDQVSPLSGWQEGAFLSSEHAVLQIAGQRPSKVLDLDASPSTRPLVQGQP